MRQWNCTFSIAYFINLFSNYNFTAAFSSQIKSIKKKSIMSKMSKMCPRGKIWEKIVLTAAGWIIVVLRTTCFLGFLWHCTQNRMEKFETMTLISRTGISTPLQSELESAPPNHLKETSERLKNSISLLLLPQRRFMWSNCVQWLVCWAV